MWLVGADPAVDAQRRFCPHGFWRTFCRYFIPRRIREPDPVATLGLLVGRKATLDATVHQEEKTVDFSA